MTCRHLLNLLLLTSALPLHAQDCDQGRALYEQAMATAAGDQRLALLERSAAACADPVALAQLGLAQLHAGNAPAALEALRAARDLSGDAAQQAQIHALMAQAHLLEGQLPEAQAAIETAFDFGLDPLPPWILDTSREIARQHAGRVTPARDILRAFGTRRAMVAAHKGFTAVPRLDIYVLFDLDRDQPNDEGRQQVVELAEALAALGADTRYLLIGHTDERGADAYNQGLSERRAAALRRLLVQRQPSLDAHLSTEGRGESEPKYPGSTQEDWRLNRRVEVQVLPGS